MQDPPRYHEALSRAECDRASLEIDDELALYYIEELVVGVVLRPVILVRHHAQSDDRGIHLAEGLRIPLQLPAVDQRLRVDIGAMRSGGGETRPVAARGSVRH